MLALIGASETAAVVSSNIKESFEDASFDSDSGAGNYFKFSLLGTILLICGLSMCDSFLTSAPPVTPFSLNS